MLGHESEPARSAVVMLNDGGSFPAGVALPVKAGNALGTASSPRRSVPTSRSRSSRYAVHCAGRPERTVEDRATHVLEEVEARLSARAARACSSDSRAPTRGLRGRTASARQRPAGASRPPRHRANHERRQRTVAPVPPEVRDPRTPPSLSNGFVQGAPAVLRSARYRWRKFQFRRLIRNPGPPSFDRVRYWAFRHIRGQRTRHTIRYRPRSLRRW
jgi:hypothetical protein